MLQIQKFIKIIKAKDLLFPTLLFLISIISNIISLSPGIHGGDSGDLAVAAITGGIPHPSGYPIHTMLGFLINKLTFLDQTPAWRIGLVSSVFGSLAVVVFYKTERLLIDSKYLSFLAALTTAYTYTFWLYSVHVEVFALQVFLLLSILYASIKFIKSSDPKYLFWVSLTLGLTIANNQSILILIPALLLLPIFKRPLNYLNLKFIIKNILIFVSGLTPYLYIPVSAKLNQAYSWGKVINFENFIYLITRQQYGWSAVGNEKSIQNFRFDNYYSYLKAYVPPILLVFIILGLIFLIYKKRHKETIFITISYLLLGPFFIFLIRGVFQSFMQMSVMEKFYLQNIVILALLIGPGMVCLKQTLTSFDTKLKSKNILDPLISITLLIVPVSSYFLNYQRVDLSSSYIGDISAIDVLSSIPNDSIFIANGDSTVFNSVYVQYAYDYRKDIYIPGIFDGFEKLLELKGLDSDQIDKFTSDNKNHLKRKNFEELLIPLAKSGKVYTEMPLTYSADEEGLERAISVPNGLVYKFVLENEFKLNDAYYNNLENISKTLHFGEFIKNPMIVENNLTLADIVKWYSIMLKVTGNFIESSTGNSDLASRFIIPSILLDPIPLNL